MSFNKWFPDRVLAEDSAERARVGRAHLMRVLWWTATLMLITGYLIAALVLLGRI